MGRSPYIFFFATAAFVNLGLFSLFYILLEDPFIAWLLAVNPVTFLMFGIDKARSGRRKGRIPEMILFLLPVLGGFLGGWLGMLMLRHKTRHISFYVVMSISTGAHLLLMGFLYLGE